MEQLGLFIYLFIFELLGLNKRVHINVLCRNEAHGKYSVIHVTHMSIYSTLKEGNSLAPLGTLVRMKQRFRAGQGDL